MFGRNKSRPERVLALRVEGMHCSNCGLLIDESLEDMPGIRRARTNVRRGITELDTEDSEGIVDDVLDKIAELGYGASVIKKEMPK